MASAFFYTSESVSGKLASIHQYIALENKTLPRWVGDMLSSLLIQVNLDTTNDLGPYTVWCPVYGTFVIPSFAWPDLTVMGEQQKSNTNRFCTPWPVLCEGWSWVGCLVCEGETSRWTLGPCFSLLRSVFTSATAGGCCLCFFPCPSFEESFWGLSCLSRAPCETDSGVELCIRAGLLVTRLVHARCQFVQYFWSQRWYIGNSGSSTSFLGTEIAADDV